MSYETEILVGNIAKAKNKNSTKRFHWIVFVRSLDDSIEKVQFVLHPSFKKGRYFTSREPPYEHKTQGWGRFFVKINVTFVDNTKKKLYHMLEFGDASGEWNLSKLTKHVFKISKVVKKSSLKGDLSPEDDDSDSDSEDEDTDLEYKEAYEALHRKPLENETSETLFKRGNGHVNVSMDFGNAILDYTKALKMLPKDDKSELRYNLYFNRAVCFEKFSKMEGSFSDLQKCFEIDPSSTEVREKMEAIVTKLKSSLDRYRSKKKDKKAFQVFYTIYRKCSEDFTKQDVVTLFEVFLWSFLRYRSKKKKESEEIRKLYKSFQNDLNEQFSSFIVSKCPHYFFQKNEHRSKKSILSKCNDFLLNTLITSFDVISKTKISRDNLLKYIHHSTTFFKDFDFMFRELVVLEDKELYFGQFSLVKNTSEGRMELSPRGRGVRFSGTVSGSKGAGEFLRSTFGFLRGKGGGSGGDTSTSSDPGPYYILQYVGEFNSCGDFDGEGALYDSKKNLLYEGGYEDGEKSGKGVEYKFSTITKDFVMSYEGQFKTGIRHGQGEMYEEKTGKIRRGRWEDGALTKEFESFSCPILNYGDVKKFLKDGVILGSGAFGIIYKVKTSVIQTLLQPIVGKNYLSSFESLTSSSPKRQQLDEFVALKIMSFKSRYEKIVMFRNLKRTLELCARLKSEEAKSSELKSSTKHILEILCIIEGPRQIGYVMQLCKVSVDHVISASKGTMPMSEKKRILYQTALGINGLHSQNIMHRDLKWGNVLMSFDDVVKITDFDTLREDEREWKLVIKTMTSRVGTPGFLAPEVFSGKKYSLKCDVFSFAMMIYSILFERNQPFTSQYSCSCGCLVETMFSSRNLSYHVAHHNFRPLVDPKLIASFPKYLIDLMIHSWDEDPLKRPSFDDVLRIMKGEMEKSRCYAIISLTVLPSLEEEKKKRREEGEEEGEEEEDERKKFEDIISKLQPSTGDSFGSDEGQQESISSPQLRNKVLEFESDDEEENEEEEEEDNESSDEEDDDEDEGESSDDDEKEEEDEKKKRKKKRREKKKFFEEKLLIVEPRVEKLVEMIEKKFDTKLEGFLQHKVLGEIRSDEELFRLIKKETHPSIVVRVKEFDRVVETKNEMRRKGMDLYFSSSSEDKTREIIENLKRRNQELEKGMRNAKEEIKMKDIKISELERKLEKYEE